jgi:hypothetical protein
VADDELDDEIERILGDDDAQELAAEMSEFLQNEINAPWLNVKLSSN